MRLDRIFRCAWSLCLLVLLLCVTFASAGDVFAAEILSDREIHFPSHFGHPEQPLTRYERIVIISQDIPHGKIVSFIADAPLFAWQALDLPDSEIKSDRILLVPGSGAVFEGSDIFLPVREMVDSYTSTPGMDGNSYSYTYTSNGTLLYHYPDPHGQWELLYRHDGIGEPAFNSVHVFEECWIAFSYIWENTEVEWEPLIFVEFPTFYQEDYGGGIGWLDPNIQDVHMQFRYEGQPVPNISVLGDTINFVRNLSARFTIIDPHRKLHEGSISAFRMHWDGTTWSQRWITPHRVVWVWTIGPAEEWYLLNTSSFNDQVNNGAFAPGLLHYVDSAVNSVELPAPCTADSEDHLQPLTAIDGTPMVGIKNVGFAFLNSTGTWECVQVDPEAQGVFAALDADSVYYSSDSYSLAYYHDGDSQLIPFNDVITQIYILTKP